MNEILTYNNTVPTVGGYALTLPDNAFYISGTWTRAGRTDRGQVMPPNTSANFTGIRCTKDDIFPLQWVTAYYIVTADQSDDGRHMQSASQFAGNLHIKNFEITTTATPCVWYYDSDYREWELLTNYSGRFQYYLGNGSSAPWSNVMRIGTQGTYRYTAEDVWTPAINTNYTDFINLRMTATQGGTSVARSPTWSGAVFTASGIFANPF